jgi:hypothetical protein
MRWLLVLIAVGAGCGRLGFDETIDGGGGGHSTMTDADTLVTRDGVVVQPSSWMLAATPPGVTNSLWGVQAFSPTDIWVSGVNGYLSHFDGSAWSPSQSGTVQGGLFIFWAASPSDIWLVGDGCKLLRWQGASWAAMAVNGCTGQKALYSIDGTSTSNVWVVGANGNLFAYNGSTWTNFYQGNYTFWSVAVRSPSDVLISGENGEVLRWTTTFASETAPNLILTAVIKVSATESWIIGENGTALHSTTPGTWTSVPTPVASGTLYGAYAAAANDIWAVGTGGVIIHYDGAAWSQVESPTTTTLRNVTGIPGGGLIAVGDGGVVLTHP